MLNDGGRCWTVLIVTIRVCTVEQLKKVLIMIISQAK